MNNQKNDNFEPVQMWRCRWCGKIYHTRNHSCKFKPSINGIGGCCFSCKYMADIIQKVSDDGVCGYVKCRKREGPSLMKLSKQKWVYDECCDYEMVNGWEGKKTYLQRVYSIEHDHYQLLTQRIQNPLVVQWLQNGRLESDYNSITEKHEYKLFFYSEYQTEVVREKFYSQIKDELERIVGDKIALYIETDGR